MRLPEQPAAWIRMGAFVPLGGEERVFEAKETMVDV